MYSQGDCTSCVHMRGKYYEFGAGDCTGAQRYAQSAHSGKVVQCLLAPPHPPPPPHHPSYHSNGLAMRTYWGRLLLIQPSLLHTHTHTHTHTLVNNVKLLLCSLCIPTCVSMCVCIHLQCTYTLVCMYSACMCVRTCICACVCACVCAGVG